MRKRLLRAVAALLIGLTAGLVALPSTSYAASGLTTTGGSYVTPWIYEAPIGSDWRIGDCTMRANYDPSRTSGGEWSYARLVQPDSAGNSTVYIFEATQTAASPTDVWWTTLTFQTAFGTPILVTPRLEGAQMTRVNTLYTYMAWASVTVDPQLFPLISTVRWESSC